MVEHRHDVALIVTAHRESDPGGQRALVREDHVTEEERAQHFQSRNPPLGIPILECPRVLLHVDLLVEPVHLLLFRLHFVGAPSSHKCQSFVRGASIAATPPRGLRQVRGVLDEGRVEEEPQHERQHPDHLGGFPHRGGGHLPGPRDVLRKRGGSRSAHFPRISIDRISCRMSTRLLSGTASAMVISSAVSVFGGALPKTVPSTKLRSACARVPPGPTAPRLPHSRCWIQVGLPSTMSSPPHRWPRAWPPLATPFRMPCT